MKHIDNNNHDNNEHMNYYYLFITIFILYNNVIYSTITTI